MMVLYSAIAVLILSVAALFWIVSKIRDVDDELEYFESAPPEPLYPGKMFFPPAAGPADAVTAGLEKKIEDLQKKVESYSGIFAQWQKNKENILEKIVLSGLKQEVRQQSSLVDAVAKEIDRIKKDSLEVSEGYNELKNSVSETLSKQISLLPRELQPIISEYQQESQTIILLKENFLKKLREKDARIASAVSKFQELSAQRESELLSKKEDFRELRSAMREGLSALNSKIQELIRVSEEEKKYTESEIESLKAKKENIAHSAGDVLESGRENIARVRLQVSRELELLKSEIKNTEAANSENINKKEEEILSLNSQILEIENQIQSNRSVFERMVEKFKRRIGHRQQLADERKRSIEAEQGRIIKEKKEEYEKLKNEVVSAEESLKKELELELSSYAEEEASLMKAKQDYEGRLSVLKNDYSTRMSEYESEISKLKQKIVDSEKRWEDEFNLKKGNFEQEKEMLFGKLKSIREHVEQEQLGRQELVDAMRSEFKQINESSAGAIQQLKTEFRDSGVKFKEKKEALLAQISEVSKLLELERTSMEESTSAKLAELNALRRRYLELSDKAESEKKELAFKVESQQKKLREDLEELEKLYQDELSLTSSEKKTLEYQLATLKIENSNREKEYKLSLEKKRAESDKINSELNSEISRIKAEMAKKKELFEKTIREADAEIRKLSRDIAVKESELKEAEAKTGITIKKATDSVVKSIESVKKKIEAYKARITDELKSKNEEIQTLKVRLSLRDEMIENELAKKEEAMSNITQRLKVYTDQLQEDSRKQSNQAENSLKPLISKIDHLKKISSALQEKIENQRTKQRVFAAKMERLEKEIKILESEPPGDFMQLERLLRLKEKEAGLLSREIIQKESVLMDSSEIFESGIGLKQDSPSGKISQP